MLNIIKDGTKSNIIVGRNGRLLAKGGDLELRKKVVQKIQDCAHLENLTNKIQDYLDKNKGKGEK